MRLKIMFALLIFTLVAGQVVYGQGYNVTRPKDQMTVAQYANNAKVSDLTFDYGSDAPLEYAIDAADDLTFKIGYGLLITNDDTARDKITATFELICGANPCAGDTDPSALISNEGGTGVITITVGTTHKTFTVRGVRVDASALALEDEIVAIVTSTTSPDSVLLGGSDASGGVSGAVGVVAAGLKVTAEKDADLACSAADPEPSITVAEGFGGAWGPANTASDASGIDAQTASVLIALDNLPDDAKVTWPATVNSLVEAVVGSDADGNDIKAPRSNGTLTKNDAESSSNGKVVVYRYERKATYTDTGDADRDFTGGALTGARSFKVTPDKVEFSEDASVDVSAKLFPAATRSAEEVKLNLDSELTFEAELQNPMDDDGNNTGEGWLVISECVTYLLYPFVTCGSTPGWTTGISVSNTSADGNVFGAFDESKEQEGSVVMYGFPSDPILSADDTVEPVVATVEDKLAAGATITVDCSHTTMAGMEGYAIIRAGFQHARGMAFVFGNFADGASVDVSHGYMAEVITDPADRSEAIE